MSHGDDPAKDAERAALVASAPALRDEIERLRAAVAELCNRFEACIVSGGSDPIYAAEATKKYRAILSPERTNGQTGK